MRKYIFYCLIIISFFLASCNEKKSIEIERQLTVSILPQKQMLVYLSAGYWEVQVLLPPGSNHETYEPTPQDMKKLANSSLFFTIGALDFETTWIDRFQSSNPNLQIIPTNTGIKMLSGHIHNHENENHENENQHGIDPHIWLSPKCLKIQAQNICNSLSIKDTANKVEYAKRLTAFIAQADSVDSVIRSILSKSDGKSILIYHPALGYFAQDYNLNQISIENEGKEPSASHLIELTELAKKQNVKAVFISKEFDTRHAEAIAKAINAKVIVFDPMAEDWSKNLIALAKLIAEN